MIDSYIAKKTPEQQLLLGLLHQLITQTSAQIEPRFSFGCPFYYYKGMFCYLNAVRNGIDLGFCRGVDLSNEQGILETRNRKQVRSVFINSIETFNALQPALLEILHECLLLHDFLAIKQRNKK